MPPSAITGTPRAAAAREHSMIELIIGTPMPATTRVVQIEPAPMPTFTLVHEYGGGRLTLYHVDLYRLDRTGADDLGLEEMSVADGILAIEWPDRLTHRPPGAMSIEIEIVDETTRRIVIGNRV